MDLKSRGKMFINSPFVTHTSPTRPYARRVQVSPLSFVTASPHIAGHESAEASGSASVTD